MLLSITGYDAAVLDSYSKFVQTAAQMTDVNVTKRSVIFLLTSKVPLHGYQTFPASIVYPPLSEHYLIGQKLDNQGQQLHLLTLLLQHTGT